MNPHRLQTEAHMEQEMIEPTKEELEEIQISPEEWAQLATEYAEYLKAQEDAEIRSKSSLAPSEWERAYELGFKAGLNQAILDDQRKI